MTPRPLADLRFLGFHALFLTAGSLLLVLPSTAPMGWRLFFAGVIYNIGFPVFAVSCVEPRWVRLWSFVFPLSLLQIFPDWHLAQNLGTLVFPDLGFPQVGPVSLFMGLLWAVPLVLIVETGERLAERFGLAAAAFGAAALSLVIFGIAEATLTLIPVWHAQNVGMVGPRGPLRAAPGGGARRRRLVGLPRDREPRPRAHPHRRARRDADLRGVAPPLLVAARSVNAEPTDAAPGLIIGAFPKGGRLRATSAPAPGPGPLSLRSRSPGRFQTHEELCHVQDSRHAL
ncbi:MAG: hypothetical protein AAGF23_22475 [Acidobacteriota bacterium]